MWQKEKNIFCLFFKEIIICIFYKKPKNAVLSCTLNFCFPISIYHAGKKTTLVTPKFWWQMVFSYFLPLGGWQLLKKSLSVHFEMNNSFICREWTLNQDISRVSVFRNLTLTNSDVLLEVTKQSPIKLFDHVKQLCVNF